MDFFADIPNELLAIVTMHMPMDEVLHLSAVNKDLRRRVLRSTTHLLVTTHHMLLCSAQLMGQFRSVEKIYIYTLESYSEIEGSYDHFTVTRFVPFVQKIASSLLQYAWIGRLGYEQDPIRSFRDYAIPWCLITLDDRDLGRRALLLSLFESICYAYKDGSFPENLIVGGLYLDGPTSCSTCCNSNLSVGTVGTHCLGVDRRYPHHTLDGCGFCKMVCQCFPPRQIAGLECSVHTFCMTKEQQVDMALERDPTLQSEMTSILRQFLSDSIRHALDHDNCCTDNKLLPILDEVAYLIAKGAKPGEVSVHDCLKVLFSRCHVDIPSTDEELYQVYCWYFSSESWDVLKCLGFQLAAAESSLEQNLTSC
jgi:hypothetical protein